MNWKTLDGDGEQRTVVCFFFIGNNKESFRAPAFRGYLTYFDDQQIRKKKYLVALFVNS